MCFLNFVKIVALSAIPLWVIGCTSTTSGEKTSSENASSEIVTAAVETTPVLDHPIQAVINNDNVQSTSEQIEKIFNKSTYHFDFDSSQLSADDCKALDVQAVYLNAAGNRGKKIIIQGHTDERGTRTYNLALGERRANSVKNYLVAKGVSSRIEVISFGFEKPLDHTHNEEAWAKNRRAHIIIN